MDYFISKRKFVFIVIMLIWIIFLTWLVREIWVQYSIRLLCNVSKENHMYRLQNLLQYCCNNIPYYYEIDPMDLQNFPIVNKKVINNNQKLFMSPEAWDNRIVSSKITANNTWTKKKELNSESSTIKNLSYVFQLLIYNRSVAQVTGGSSNEYFYQWLNYHDIKAGSYSFMKGLMNMGFRPGKRILLYYFHGANTVKLMKTILLYSRDVKVLIPKIDSNGDITEDGFNEFVNTVENFRPYVVIAFPNVIYRICEMAFMKNYKFTYIPPSMDLSGDMLFTCQYNFILSIFHGSDIRMSYGTVETGQIAQQIPGKMFNYIVYDDIAIVEQGPVGTLLITVLKYRTLPMVRYHVDDKGTVIQKSTHTEIHNLLGKTSNDIDYIELDNIINGFNKTKEVPTIINLRIDKEQKRLHVKTLVSKYSFPTNSNVFRKLFPTYTLIIESCVHDECPTIDRYDRKNTPILLQYKF